MKEKIKELKLNITASAVISIIVGIFLLIYPQESIVGIGRIFAIFVIIIGIAAIIGQVVEFGVNVMGIIVGAIITIIGLWMFASPASILSIIPIAFGVILVIHGIQDLGMAIEGSKAKAERAWSPYVIAAINIILGLLCIGNAFGLVSFAFRIIGIMLIFDGITDLGIVHKVKKAGIIDSTITSEEDIF